MTRIQSFFTRFSRSFNLSAGPLLAVTLACLPGLSHGATFGPQSSTRAAEWGFDFVEEFDGLQDWDQSGCREGGRRCGNRYDLEDPQDMPKLRDGSPSAWGYFSMWNDNTPAPVPWIGSETASGRKVWRGTKSATIDIGTTNYGPSRLGLHFGADGYRDFSLFYMAWIPKNEWPTSRDSDNVGIYTEGQPYMWIASWKFNNFELKCGSSKCRDGNPYGEDYITTLISQHNYTPQGLLMYANPRSADATRAKDSIALSQFMGDWFGVEYRITTHADNKAYDLQIWVYDKQGNSWKIMNGQTFPIHADAQGGVWDRFFFGGNNSGVYLWGPSMQSRYFVDDLIIDAGHKGRIGPRYFGKIQGALPAPPSPPLHVGGAQAVKN